jgi:hypothetical protein
MTEQTLTATVVDGETGEVVERPLTNDEIAELEVSKNDYDQKEAERQAKTAARKSALAKLAALGLTQEEIEAL